MNGDMGAGTVKQAAAGAPASAPKHMAEGALPNTAIRRIRCCRMALQRQGFWQPLQGSVAVAKRSCYSNESEPVGGVQAFDRVPFAKNFSLCRRSAAQKATRRAGGSKRCCAARSRFQTGVWGALS